MFATLAIGGCVFQSDSEDKDQQATTTQTPPPAPQPAPPPQPQMRLEVNIAARELHVYEGDRVVATHPVAVGSKKWPTPTGEWTISQVVFNPEWIPPKDESWAEDEKPSKPGDPDNPLGVVQLVYSPPNSIHGTNEPQSLGKAVSHGSIRVSNEVGIQLAKQVMKAGGAQKDDAFVESALAKRTEKQIIDLPNPVPIRVIEGDSAS